MDINPQRLGLWIVSIRTFCKWQTGSDSAVPQGSLGWDTLTHVEASVCGNVLRELGSKGNPLSHSPKVSGSVPSAQYFHTLDLFLQPVCFWSQVADEAKMFIPSRSVLRHGWASSAARLQMWPSWDRHSTDRGIPIFLCYRQPQGCSTIRFFSVLAEAELQQCQFHPRRGATSWDQPEGQIQPWKTASRMTCRSKGYCRAQLQEIP